MFSLRIIRKIREQLIFYQMAFRPDVQYIDFLRDEIPSNKVMTVAFGWVFLAAHHRDALISREREQLLYAGLETLFRHDRWVIHQMQIIGVSIRYLAVFITLRIIWPPSKAVTEVLICQSSGFKSSSNIFPVKLWVILAVWGTAHIHKCCDVISFQ